MLPLERPPFSLQHITILSWVCQVCQIKQWMVILILNLEMEAVHILSQSVEAGGELTWAQPHLFTSIPCVSPLASRNALIPLFNDSSWVNKFLITFRAKA